MFIQLHALVTHSGVLLNRDDTGMAKTLQFGNLKRTRVSSQCLKYHWRRYITEKLDDEFEQSVQSRQTFVKLLDEFQNKKLATVCLAIIKDAFLTGNTNKKGVTKSAKNAIANIGENGVDNAHDVLQMSNTVTLGKGEIAYIKQLARRAVNTIETYTADEEDYYYDFFKDNKPDIPDKESYGGLKAALFGRMTTSSLLSRVDSSVAIAHAFTVNAAENTTDYFTATDDYNDSDGELGSSHLGHKNLTSGTFYSYVSISIPTLVHNLGYDGNNWREADKELRLVKKIVRAFTETFARHAVTGAKEGSTAPHARPHVLMCGVGKEQPFSFERAFESGTDDAEQALLDEKDAAVQQYDLDTEFVVSSRENGRSVSDIVNHALSFTEK